MNISELEKSLNTCLTAEINDQYKITYEENLVSYLDEHGLDSSVISIAVQGIGIDRCANMLDFIVTLTEADIQEAWKLIKKSSEIRKNYNYGSVKLYLALLTLALMKEGNLFCLTGKIISALIKAMNISAPEELSDELKRILNDYFIEDFTSSFTPPSWSDIKCSDENIILFCEIILDVISQEAQVHSLKFWVKSGVEYSTKRIDDKKLQELLPVSHVKQIEDFLKHYTDLIDDLSKHIEETVHLKSKVAVLEKENSRLQSIIEEQNSAIHSLDTSVSLLKTEIDSRNSEIKELRALNATYESSKKDGERALLNDISNSIKAEYSDYMESINDDMDLMLGEIYREKLRNVFRLLETKGIKVH